MTMEEMIKQIEADAMEKARKLLDVAAVPTPVNVVNVDGGADRGLTEPERVVCAEAIAAIVKIVEDTHAENSEGEVDRDAAIQSIAAIAIQVICRGNFGKPKVAADGDEETVDGRH